MDFKKLMNHHFYFALTIAVVMAFYAYFVLSARVPANTNTEELRVLTPFSLTVRIFFTTFIAVYVASVIFAKAGWSESNKVNNMLNYTDINAPSF